MKKYLVYPIENLCIEDAVQKEMRVDSVLFVDTDKFKNSYRRFGIKKKALDELDEKRGKDFFECPAMGLFKYEGDVESDDVVPKMQEELEILCGSQIGWKKRTTITLPRVQGMNTNRQMNFFVSRQGDNRLYPGFSRYFMLGEMRLSRFWKQFVYDEFFKNSLSLIRLESTTDPKWKNILRRVFVLCGKSQGSISKADAFLYNMIALETLLLNQGEKYPKVMPKRIEALLGWTPHWTNPKFLHMIKGVYGKRNTMVHDGILSGIKMGDIAHTDEILGNILLNVCNHPRMFPNKPALIEFCEKRNAEKILGIKSKLLPKTFKGKISIYSSSDLDKMKMI